MYLGVVDCLSVLVWLVFILKNSVTGIAPEAPLRLVVNLRLDLCNAGFIQCRPLFRAQRLVQVHGASGVRHNVLSGDGLCNGSVPALLRSYKGQVYGASTASTNGNRLGV